jgi:hypothetical protein
MNNYMDNDLITNKNTIKELYWGSSYSVGFLKERTGLKLKDIIIIAGNFESNCYICNIKLIFKNRTNRRLNTLFKHSPNKQNKISENKIYLCNDCINIIKNYNHLNKIKKIKSFNIYNHSEFNNNLILFLKTYGLECAKQYLKEIQNELYDIHNKVMEKINE